ncbi:MAG: hypothetical protein AB4352_00245 [Hormoscilla sp.]
MSVDPVTDNCRISKNTDLLLPTRGFIIFPAVVCYSQWSGMAIARSAPDWRSPWGLIGFPNARILNFEF